MAATEQVFAASPLYAAGQRIVQSPFQFVADADTFLRIVSVCSVSGVTVAIQGRRLDEHGELQVLEETHAPNSNRTTKTQDYKLGLGAVLNLALFASQGAPLSGQCYVMAQLLRNFGGTAIVLGTLLGGYVTATQALGFPGSPIVSSTSGEPAIRNIIGTTPAAGVEWLETVPTGARWSLANIIALLTTNSTAVARQVFFHVKDAGGHDLGYYAQANSQNASTQQFYTMGPGLFSTQASGGGITVDTQACPNPLLMTAGCTIGSFTGNLQGGDQWSQPQYTVREWLEVN